MLVRGRGGTGVKDGSTYIRTRKKAPMVESKAENRLTIHAIYSSGLPR